MPKLFKKFLFLCALAVIAARPSIAADSLVVSPQHPTTSDSISLSIFAKDWNCCTQFLYDSTAVTLLNGATITLGFTANLPVPCWCPSNPATRVLTYKRGPLPAGNYSVYEQYQSCTGQVCSDVIMQVLIGTFTVSQRAADSLVVSPVHPTTTDPIRLSIVHVYQACYCNPPYVHDSTAVTLINDSTIMLNFTIDTPLTMCMCFVGPPYEEILTYKRGPLPAGTYSVYEQYRSPEVMMQMLIGTFTVTQPAAVLFRPKPVTKENIGKMPGNVRVYDIRGAIVSSNLTGARKMTSGVYFIRPDNCPAVKIVLATR
jgi:hypothetical protein